MTWEEVVEKSRQRARGKRRSMPRARARRLLEAFAAVVIEAVRNGERVRVQPLGVFYAHDAKARAVVDPDGRRLWSIPKRRTLKFRAGLTARKAVAR